MNSVQESKNELEAAIRYAENAISSAKQTIESMEFRQQMAQKGYQEQTGREKALDDENIRLQKVVIDLETFVEELRDDKVRLNRKVEPLEREVAELRGIIDRMGDDAKGDSVTIKFLNEENDRLKRQKEASSGPCGCQAYRDLEEARGRAEGEVELLQGTIKELEEFNAELSKQNVSLAEGKPTMPVIPKAVAIAIFREGVQHGVEAACTELEGQTIMVEESEYVSNFEVSFTKEIDLDDELDLDWMRGKLGRYDEGFVTDALSNLCADKEFECRIHGVDDQKEKKND